MNVGVDGGVYLTLGIDDTLRLLCSGCIVKVYKLFAIYLLFKYRELLAYIVNLKHA